MGMNLVGIGFKLALVPFHFWAADVYEGAPAPVTALIATVSKGAVFAVLLRYFDMSQMQTRAPFLLIFTVVALVTMFVGNYLALLQDNLKRLLAYSSIAHMGYLLVAFLAGGRQAVTAVTFYFVAYFITTLGAFGVITALSGKEKTSAISMTTAGCFPLSSRVRAGCDDVSCRIPLTAGFLAKFYVLFGIGSNLWAARPRADRQQRRRTLLLSMGHRRYQPLHACRKKRPSSLVRTCTSGFSAVLSWPC
jgi:NADH-quinone oxidoreductase subunit N